MNLSHAPEPAIVGACLVIVGVAAFTDYRTRHIPNLLTLGGLTFGLVAHGAMGFVDGGAHGALNGVFRAFISALICMAVPLVSFIRKEMGGGDVKLFAAIGAMVGLNLGFLTVAATFAISLLFLTPWVAVRSGLLRAKLQHIRAKMRGESVADLPKVKAPRVVLAPAILVALCFTILRAVRAGLIHLA